MADTMDTLLGPAVASPTVDDLLGTAQPESPQTVDDLLQLPQESFPHRDPNLVSTIAGVPALRVAGAPGAGKALGRQIVQGGKDAVTWLTTTPEPVQNVLDALTPDPNERLLADARQMQLADEVSPPAAQDEWSGTIPYSNADKILAGAAQGVGDTAKFFTTPLGIATLGIGTLPKLAQKTIAGIFAAQMASQTPELATQLGTEMGKPADQRDVQKIARLVTASALNTGFTVAGAFHALPEKFKTPAFDETTKTAPPETPPAPIVDAAGNPATITTAAGVDLQPQISATHDPASPQAFTLVPPGATVPADHGLAEIETAQGTALVNPLKADPEDVKAQVEQPQPAPIVAPPPEAPAPTPPPEEILTESQKMSREAVQAMAELRAQKQAASTIESQPQPTESEDQNAITQRTEPSDDGGQHPGIAPGPDLPAHAEEIRQEESGPAGGGDRGSAGAEIPLGERPPDILDWIGDNFKRGVRTTSTADYGEYVKTATGKARELVSNAKGERAERVLQAMHAEGLYPRIETEDDLLDAMNRAASARMGWRETNRQADIYAKLDALKMDAAGQLHAFGLAPVVWNALIDGVKLAVRGGLALKDAIDQALAKLKASGQSGIDFDEAGARAHLNGLEERGFMEKLRQSADVADAIKGGVQNTLYTRRTNETDAQLASRLIEQSGSVWKAMDLFNDKSADIPGSVRGLLGQLIIKQLSASGRLDDAIAFHDNSFAAHITDVAQTLQAQRAWLALTPEGQILWAKRQIDRAAEERTSPVKPDLQKAKDELQQANDEGADKLATDEDVTNAGGRALDATAENDATKLGTDLQAAIRNEVLDQLVKGGLITAREAEILKLHLEEPGAATLAAKLNSAGIPNGETRAKLLNELYKAKTQREREGIKARARKTRTDLQAEQKKKLSEGERSAQRLINGFSKVQKDLPDWTKTKGDEVAKLVRKQLKYRDLTDEQFHGRLRALGVEDNSARVLTSTVRKEIQNIDAIHFAKNYPMADDKIDQARARKTRTDLQAEQKKKLSEGERSAQRLINGFSKVQKDLPDWTKTKGDEVAKLVRKQLKYRDLTDEQFHGRLRALGVEDNSARVLTSTVRKEIQNIDAIHFAKNYPMADDKIDQALRKQLRVTGQKMSYIIRSHFTRQERAGKDLADSLVKEAGLTGDAAHQLAEAALRRFRQLTAAAKQRALEKVLKPVQRAGIAKPGLTERLIQLSNLGVLDEAKYWNAVKEKLDLPQWSPELQAKLKAQADRIASIPEDRQNDWQEAQTRFMNTLERAKGFSWFDANHAFFITNLLSGFSTHARVAIHTSLNLTGGISAEVARAIASGRLADIPLIFEAAARGGGKSLGEQVNIMKSGLNPNYAVHGQNIFAQKFHELSRYGTTGGVPIDTTRGNIVSRGYAKALKTALELYPAKILNLWKYNDRLVTAQHVLYFKPAEEIKAALLTSRLQRAQGLSASDAAAKAREILGYGAEAVDQARAQATAEGLTGNAAKRRAGEILESRRPVAVREDARQYALRQTFLNEPYGFVGALAEAAQSAKNSNNAMLSGAARVVAPFTRIAANLFNEGLNYTPVGALRAKFVRNSLLGFDLADMTVDQRNDLKGELYAKAALGTALFGGLAIKAAMNLGNPNPAFTIYGSGPSDPQDQQRWRATGAIPWSFKVGGRYISFANTPANIFWGAFGNYLDRLRDARLYHSKPAERVADDAIGSAAVGLMGAGNVMLQQPFLQSLTELTGMASENNPELAARQAEKFAARTTSSFMVPNLLRQLDRIGDPTIYDQKKLDGILTSSVPFVRREGRPVLNVLGQPMQSPLTSMFTSERTTNPLIQTLDRYNVWPSTPQRNATLVDGKPLTDDEYYKFVQARGAYLNSLDPATVDMQLKHPGITQKGKGKTAATVMQTYDEQASERGKAAVRAMR